MSEVQIAVERLVNNVAIEQGISRDRAIFLLESLLGDLKRRPPTAPTPPVISLEKAA